MNRHSIFFKLSLVFALTCFFVGIVYVLLLYIFYKQEVRTKALELIQIHESIEALAYEGDIEEIQTYLHEIDVQVITEQQVEITSKGEYIPLPVKDGTLVQFFEDNFTARGTSRPRIRIIEYQDAYYAQSNGEYHHLLLGLDGFLDRTFLYLLSLSFVFVLVCLGLLYFVLRKNLSILKSIEQGVLSYERGEIDNSLQNNGKDEISTLSNTLHQSFTNLEDIQNARKLFLRNIVHELKTPLAKGKFYTQILQEQESNKSVNGIERALDKIEALGRFSTA